MKLPSGSTAESIGFALCRIIVPLWVLSGAFMKMVSKTPSLLPKNIWTTADGWGVNLYWLLFILVALEFLAVAVMFFLPRFAKPMAVWMLSLFCLILIAEIAAGNAKCGCLGAFSPSPLMMLAIDGALLIAVLLFPQPRAEGGWLPRKLLGFAAAFTLVGTLVGGVLILGENRGGGPDVVTNGGPGGGPTDGGGDGGSTEPRTPDGPASSDLPPYFTLKDVDSWRGQPFRETPLAAFVSDLPEDLDVGPAYVIVYSKSCDHCQSYLEMHFQSPPVPTAVVSIPERKSGFDESLWLPMAYCEDCVTQHELPVGTDWLMTPPIVFALENGDVACVREADDPQDPECLTWHF